MLESGLDQVWVMEAIDPQGDAQRDGVLTEEGGRFGRFKGKAGEEGKGIAKNGTIRGGRGLYKAASADEHVFHLLALPHWLDKNLPKSFLMPFTQILDKVYIEVRVQKHIL